MDEVKYVIDDVVQEEKKETKVDTDSLFAPQRLQNESFEEYKERRLVAKHKLEQMSAGKLIWDSRNQGTYIK